MEGGKALAGVKIGEHVQEELVEQSVVGRGDVEGLGGIILGFDAVIGVVLIEVEQAACMKSQLSLAQRATGSGLDCEGYIDHEIRDQEQTDHEIRDLEQILTTQFAIRGERTTKFAILNIY